MRVLVALDKFKDSISAEAACEAAASAITSARGGWIVDTCPLSDGGEGFCGVLTRSAGGAERRIEVTGPRGARVEAPLGFVPMDRIPMAARTMLGAPASQPGGFAAVVEMASASGLALLRTGDRDLTRASSAGTGELIRAAAAAGARLILLGVGGSATHDLGLGALGALGVRFEGAGGESLNPLVPAEWGLLRAIRGSIPQPFPTILIACDVENPLLGKRGALSVYGPQKGLKAADASRLEAATARVAEMVRGHFGGDAALAARPGAGAAGGIAFGLMAAANARILPGFGLVSAWMDLDERLTAADMVVTGEGRFDDSSLEGKGPGTVVRRALSQGKIVHVFAGQVALARRIPGLFVHPVTPEGMALPEALASAPVLLSQAVLRAFAEG